MLSAGGALRRPPLLFRAKRTAEINFLNSAFWLLSLYFKTVVL
jgi:hypothetical protein